MNELIEKDQGTPPAQASKNSAWVKVPSTWSTKELQNVCHDIEAIFRVNPYYYFSSWIYKGENTYHAKLENHSNKRNLDIDITIAFTDNGFVAAYADGLKTHTTFTIEPGEKGALLTIIDHYADLTQQEQKDRDAEVDKSLQAWGIGLAAYFARLKKWSKIPGWRWYIRRVWIPMKPSARRVVWWLYLITLAEFGFFLFVYLIWLLERTGGS